MKAKVDQEACVGSQECVETCPEVFRMEGEKSHVYVDEVPKEAEGKCQSAKDGCPAAAISIES